MSLDSRESVATAMGIPASAVQKRTGPRILLMGAIGSGKSYSVRSLVQEGFKVRILATAPGYESAIADLPDVAVHYVPAYNYGESGLTEMYKLLRDNQMETLQKMGGVRKEKNNQIEGVIKSLGNFVDDRTGQSLGKMADWDTDTFLVVDDLSGLNVMAEKLIIGDKPAASWPEFNGMQELIRNIVNVWLFTLKCGVLILAHTERETDQLTGASNITLSTIGRQLGPDLMRFFDDILLAEQIDANKWNWASYRKGVTLKSRHLPQSDKLDPNFKLLLANWRKGSK